MMSAATKGTTGDDPVRLEYLANFEYDYAGGQYASKFMSQLRDTGKMYGTKCTNCGRVYVPPRPVCGICPARTGDWVEVGPTGTITGFTVVEVPFIDPMTGTQRPVPYGFAFIKLDGADTNIYHFLEESRHDRLAVGMAVEAVFRDERIGSMADIVHFRLVDGGEGQATK